MQSTKKHSFWKIYAIVFCAALLLVLAFFFVFFDIMRNYEQSQPTSGAEAFLDSLTSETLDSLIVSSVSDSDPLYDDRDAVLHELRGKVVHEALTYRKDYTAYTAEQPVFIISCGELPVYRITLTAGESIRYGFRAWKIAKTETLLSAHDLAEKTSQVCVPSGAILSVNGIEVSVPPSGTAPYRYVTKWEVPGTLLSDCYEIDHIYDAEFTCSLDGTACEMKTEQDALYFLYPDDAFTDYVIQAPDTAVVTVNGITLDKSTLVERDIPYDTTPIEATLRNLPTAVAYEIKGLAAKPQITVKLADRVLSVSQEDNTFYAAYPEELRFSCTVRVPAGSRVSLHGVPCTADMIQSTEYEREELFSYSAQVPAYEIYAMDGLLLAPENIEIIYRGAALPFSETAEGNAYTFDASYPKIESPDTEKLALDFVKDYFIYTSNGYRNLKQNLANVLKYIPYGCNLYVKIVQSENGFSWTAPVASMTYNTLEVTDIISYPNGMNLCRVEFDVSQVFSDYSGQVTRAYRGVMMVLLASNGKVVGMEIDTHA
ncbi:MAG: hypothetical protein IKL84_04670 [Clostridia bacterium]|nr:hypothetical protein [Clostridia bacterium]